MATRHKAIVTRALLIAAFILYNIPVHAQLLAAGKYRSVPADTSGNIASNYHSTSSTAISENKKLSPANTNSLSLYDKDATMLENLKSGLKKPGERKKLMAYLKQLSVNNNLNYNQSHAKLYYHLANTFARLRFYPLAMKCFFKTMQYNERANNNQSGPLTASIDSLQQQPALTNTDSSRLTTGYLGINTNDDSVLNEQPALFEDARAVKDSKAITYKRIINTFNDGKKAVAYALLFHVKQPVPGKRKIFALTNTGHTFITLIKYNADSTYVSLSFGFYPRKDNILSATPLEPYTSAVFKDDSEHQWDEVLGKFISRRRFGKILALTQKYNGMEYHLSKNNCTDFGIDAAALAGINIQDTSGKWPLGSGNNPAVTGQSILQGKFKNTDNGKADGLFSDWDTTVIK